MRIEITNAEIFWLIIVTCIGCVIGGFLGEIIMEIFREIAASH